MSDILHRLRLANGIMLDAEREEAAAEIERLREDNGKLRAALIGQEVGLQSEIERLHDLLREAHLALGFMPMPTRALHGLRDRIRAALGDKP